ncbi:5-oxoprolinase subunit C family protein [Nocardioides acrostichi]|uniref:Biotin-dependent carboxyltransferase family protein n=1 Tax=Nocardioides acrostichi TaxID=2784339 RepID=A0A930UZK3_9ACTN|nr:biotin-dependent carboxyltransferase family protein [Nocardioides acrostichi]MBF4161935.1 biotin-dependent carboxyltransferase family protein [Nocardioides acrostichi]
MTRTLTLHATGPLTTVQDLGRPGYAGIGVGRSGAADRGALRQGNRALGNPEGAAGLEITLGGLDVEVGDEALWLCVTGAVCDLTVDGRGMGSHAPVRVEAGARVRVGSPSVGLRSYLCVRGGVDADLVLGSRSRDLLAGLGPEIDAGTVLPVGEPAGAMPGIDHLPWPRVSADEPVVLRAVRGPRADWVADPDLLTATTWTATDRSNRVGARLDGARFEHARDRQLPSEGAWRGAVQVPPSGQPVLFLADHPVTGGYPVVAVVVVDDVDLAAQVRPGQSLRFRWVEAP